MPYTEKQRIAARIAKHDPERLYKRNRGLREMSDEELTEMEHGPLKKKDRGGWKRSGGVVIKCVLALLLISLLVVPAIAKDKSVTLSWTQVMPTPNDLAGWNIYYSETPGGSYRFLEFVGFKSVKPTYSYDCKKIVGTIGSKKQNVYFVIRSVDKEGNLSAASSPEVSLQVDGTPGNDTTPAAVPGNVTAEKK